MDDQQHSPTTDHQDPDELDGHTIEELADYLDTGRTPPDPGIESSPACQHALAALERLRLLAAADLDEANDRDDDADQWVTRVMAQIALDAHAGADIPLPTTRPDTTPVMTEGAIRALIRAAGDDQSDFLVGRIRFLGDLAAAGAPVTIGVHVTVVRGVVIPAAVEQLRTRIAAAVLRHIDLPQLSIDITVQDLDTADMDDPA